MFNSTTINGFLPSNKSKPVSPSPHFSNVSMIPPNRPHVVSKSRYSLADVSYSHYGSNSRYSSSPALLTSPNRNNLRNVNLSTQLDAKSPGFTSRIVQYNKEKKQPIRPISQSKYDKPGVFPIVHLYKKDLPLLKRKQSRSTLPNCPELGRNSIEHNRSLLEPVVQPTATKSKPNDANPRSVLDALKEISRKRLHTSEDFNATEEDGKRKRMDCLKLGANSASSSKKRQRDSPNSEHEKAPKNRIGYAIDEMAASKSSTDLSTIPIEPYVAKKQPKIQAPPPPLQQPQIPKIPTPKKSKLVDVETQTIHEVIAPEKQPNVAEPSAPETPKAKPKAPLKIFDEKPLEMLRKNRLAVLMGIPIEDLEGLDAGVLPSNKKSEVTPPSILKTSNATPTKKQVTFEAPKSDEIAPTTTTTTTATTKPEVTALTPIISNPITQTSPSIITPIVSASITNMFKKSEEKAEVTPIVTAVTNVIPSPVVVETTPKNDAKPAQIDKNQAVVSLLDQAKATFGVTNVTTASTNSSLGGFEFKLTNSQVKVAPINSLNYAPKSSVPASVTPTFSFGSSPKSATTSTMSSTSTICSPSVSLTQFAPVANAPPFSFDKQPLNFGVTSAFATVTPNVTTTPVATSAFATPTFSFGAKSPPQTTFGLPVTKATSVTTPGFGVGTTTSSFVVPFVASSPNFGTKPPPYGATTVPTTAPPPFGATHNVTSTFGAVTTTPAFGTTIATTSYGSNSFGVAVTTAPPPAFANLFDTKPKTFGVTPTTTQSTPFPNFGTPITTTVTTFNSGFGLFNATTTTSAIPAFGATPVTTTSSFGSTFGANNAIFGPAKSSGFGGNSFGGGTFGAVTTASGFASSFGGAATVTTAAFGFGTTASKPAEAFAFGGTTTTNKAFSATGSAFGAAVTNAAAVPPSNSFGGFGTTTATTTGSVFGPSTTTQSGFGSTPFASGTIFGASNNNVFGTTAPQPNGFGSTTLGASNNAFGATSGAAFGGATNPAPPPAFGQAASGAFGGGAFGFAAPAASGGFGAAKPAEGVFTFGGAPAGAAKAGVFAFGGGDAAKAAAAPSSGAFNFSAGSGPAAAPAFGGFGGGGPAPAGGFGAFGGPPPGGMFSIGSGTTAPARPRTQLKAKRRT